ncbi:MAG: hypothetical protein DRP93_03140 [Candidatus Neomarinimicrobiota bacterium]|nr:MAG: hypothetical protein DRP93_03140 [Candidatus Neomarinimicrobiota bacterium]
METVPEESAVYITGNHPAPSFWNPLAVVMKQVVDGQWGKSIEVMSGMNLKYKFTLGSWEIEAIDVNGQALPNYKLSIEKDSVIFIVIPRWKKDNW